MWSPNRLIQTPSYNPCGGQSASAAAKLRGATPVLKWGAVASKVREKLLILADYMLKMDSEQLLGLQCDCVQVLQKCRNGGSLLIDVSGSVK